MDNLPHEINKTLERFIKEITQNIAGETGFDGEFIATIIRKWEEYKEIYLTKVNKNI